MSYIIELWDGCDEPPGPPSPESRDAALSALVMEAWEQTPLLWLGRGYQRPDDDPPRWTGFIGRPFASWSMSIWLNAGMVEVVAYEPRLPADLSPEIRSWITRADRGELGYLTLNRADAETILRDPALWSLEGLSWLFEVVPSDEAHGLQTSDWIEVVAAADTTPPPLGIDPASARDIAAQNANAEWEQLSHGKRLFIVLSRSADGDLWGRALAGSADDIRRMNPHFEVFLEEEAARMPELSAAVEAIKTRVPAGFGLPLESLEMRSLPGDHRQRAR